MDGEGGKLKTPECVHVWVQRSFECPPDCNVSCPTISTVAISPMWYPSSYTMQAAQLSAYSHSARPHDAPRAVITRFIRPSRRTVSNVALHNHEPCCSISSKLSRISHYFFFLPSFRQAKLMVTGRCAPVVILVQLARPATAIAYPSSNGRTPLQGNLTPGLEDETRPSAVVMN